jgi:hypothetical protein
MAGSVTVRWRTWGRSSGGGSPPENTEWSLIRPCSEHGHQVILREILFPNPPPYREDLSGEFEAADHVGMGPNRGDVVVRLVPILLQLAEFSDKRPDVDFNWGWIALPGNVKYGALILRCSNILPSRAR